MTPSPDLLEPFEAHLLGLAFVSDVGIRARPGLEGELAVELQTPTGAVHLRGAWKASHLTRTGVQALLSQLGPHAHDWILFAPHIGRPLGEQLREAGLNYLDASGNCYLALGTAYAATVEGRRRAKTEGSKGVRAAGAKVLFALLAKPDLLSSSLRATGQAADASHQAALDAVSRLHAAGEILREGRRREWLPGGRQSAFTRWLAEYDTTLRPWMSKGRYRTADQTPGATEALLERQLAAGTCWLGGLAAGYRLARHYRGSQTVVHVRGSARALAHEVRALEDPGGNLTLLRMPCELATKGAAEGTAHPLLVYAEMLQTRDERALEAAALVRQRFLSEFA
ncbi:MAG: hypothetical protein GY946_15285 [bacterium]|nr:hypothetical protein [bacterium]